MAEYLEYNWKPNFISKDIITIPKSQKNPEDKHICVQALRGLVYQSADAEFKNNVEQDDVTLLKFLYARKFNVDEGYQLLQNHFWYRRRNSHIFKDFSANSPDIKKSLENGLPGVLSTNDRKGRCVLIFTGSNWDCSYSLLSVYRSLLFTLEHLIRNIHNQAIGFVVIVDWTEFSFRQSTNLKPSVLKLMIEGLQDCFPAKFKGIHFIGQPWYVETALTFIKPFLKEETKDRIFVHGNNLSTLHDHVHKDILPAEFGGEQPSYNPETWLKKVLEETQNNNDS